MMMVSLATTFSKPRLQKLRKFLFGSFIEIAHLKPVYLYFHAPNALKIINMVQKKNILKIKQMGASIC